MGIVANIYKSSHGDASNGGISADAKYVTIMNVPGPFEASEDAPAVLLVEGNLRRTAKLVEATPSFHEGGRVEWVEATYEGEVGPMFGGCYVETGDSRFNDAVFVLTRNYNNGPIALHDRWETPSLYAALSR